MASPIARMLARTLAWVRRTPLGSPVLPDVYWMSAGSPAASRSGGRSGAGAASRSTVVTSAREVTRGRSSAATRPASANVTSRRAPAFRRILTWRRAYSSIRSARNGG